MQSAEIELKFPVDDVDGLRNLLDGAGFLVETERTFESNTLYDTAGRTLKEDGQLLRVRQYGAKATVTHKRHPDHEDLGSMYKVRIETESEVADGAALAEIFSRLGYGPVFRYEKFRTEYRYAGSASGGAGAHLVLDETPIGNFAELEGPTVWIDRMLVELKVNQARCMTESYGKLFLAWKRETGSEAENLTFEEIMVAEPVAR